MKSINSSFCPRLMRPLFKRLWYRFLGSIPLLMMFFLSSCKAKKAAKFGKKAIDKGINPLLVVIAIVLLLSFLGSMIGFFTVLKEQKKGHSKRAIWFQVIGFTVLFCGLGALGAAPQSQAQAFHWILIIAFLVLGTLHVWFMYLFHSWSTSQSFLAELLFTLFVASLGSLGFVLLFYFLDQDGLNLVFDPTLIAFLVPFFVIACYHQWMRIPKRSMSGWVFPSNRRPNTSMIRDAVNRPHMMISIMLYEDLNNNYPYNLPLRAIPTFKFGEYFHAFINEQLQHGHRIKHHDKDPSGAPVSWIFYKHDTDKWKRRNYIDPELDFRKNEIKAGDTIVALRIVRGELVRPIPKFDLPTMQGPSQVPRQQSSSSGKPKIRIQKRN